MLTIEFHPTPNTQCMIHLTPPHGAPHPYHTVHLTPLLSMDSALDPQHTMHSPFPTPTSRCTLYLHCCHILPLHPYTRHLPKLRIPSKPSLLSIQPLEHACHSKLSSPATQVMKPEPVHPDSPAVKTGFLLLPVLVALSPYSLATTNGSLIMIPWILEGSPRSPAYV